MIKQPVGINSRDEVELLRDLDFKKMMENMQVMFCMYDMDGYFYVNSVFERIMGYTNEEMKKKKFWEIVHPDEWGWIKSRGTARLRGEKVPPTKEFRIVKKSGEVLWINVYYQLYEQIEKNVIFIAFIDVSENKRLAEELRIANEELETRVNQRTEELNRKNKELMFLNQKMNNILQNMSDGVLVVDNAGNIEILNSFFYQKSEKLIDEIKEKLKEMIAKEKTNVIKKMLDGRKSFRDEEMILQTSEGVLSLLVSGTPIIVENDEVQSGVIILRPMKDVHRLISRFSSYQATFHFEDIITKDPVMLALIENAKGTTSSMSNLLIEGESGTGKELFAQAIHNHGTRRKGPFVPINCGAIPRELISSELFGYAEGAFTGAKKGGNPGKFELASGGTLFLDEIGDMSLDQQTSLLRVIQEKMVTRIGGHQAIPVDVRIICATNKDLQAEMEKGSFRRDLYYRLNVINIKIPPLRKRPSDVTLLFNHFLEMAESSRKETTKVSDNVYNYLATYDWPGNVRELQNVVERMVHINPGTYLGLEHLPPEIATATPSSAVQNWESASSMRDDDMAIDLKKTRNLYRQRIDEVQKRLIIELLERHRGNISQVAKELGLSRTTLYKKIALCKTASQP